MNIATALTILGSFGAASTAQIVSHSLTLRREKKNFKKECYQNLYAPTIFKLTNYIQTEGLHNAFHKSDGISQEASDIFQEVMTDIESNLKYANIELINLYMVWRSRTSQPQNDMLTSINFEHELDLRFKLADMFFSHFMKINKSLKNNYKIVQKELQVPYFFIHFYFVMKEYAYNFLIRSSEIVELYALISNILQSNNNYIERIIIIRKNIHKINSKSNPQYKNSKRARRVRLSTYKLLCEIVQNFKDIDEPRANQLKEILDDSL